MGLEFEAVRAPELRGTAWLNTTRPLTLADLRGKLVLLDFWTYCCINCLHVLEDLKYLEHKYADQPLVVVGVHSPKFPHEDDAESVRQAVVRYGITHPVLLDSGRKTWDAYGVRGWPTLVLVDPRGYVLGRVSGEGNRERLDGAIGQALELLAQAEVLDERPLPLRLESEAGALDATAPLLYPGKLLADAASGTLFVADTGHHRLVRAGLDGARAEPIGSGEPGAEDGDLATATFRAPQGMALDERPLPLRLESEAGALDATAPLLYPGKLLADAASGTLFVADTGHHRLVRAGLDGARAEPIGSGEPGTEDGDLASATFRAPQGLALDAAHGWLYVADTGNHLIRRVDLAAGTVTTVAGTGAQGLRVRAGGPARETPLNSPWDVCLLDGTLYIAMAGPHQIWAYDPVRETVEPFAGNGAEGRADGPAAQASFAQPSGITTDGTRLYVADSEISAVRMIELDGAGGARVRTLAGGDLFQFGDRDGRGDQARMQHPLGIAWVPVGVPGGGAVFVADTYNHKLRRLEPAMRELATFAGRGTAGDADGAAASVRFSEPSGLSYANGQLYVADTNNHAIRVVTLREARVSTLALAGLCAPGLCLPG